MTERKIQDRLFSALRQQGHHWVCPCYTPLDWWECDMFSVTQAGLMVEHEIKLTLADFRKDREKMKEKTTYVRDHAGKIQFDLIDDVRHIRSVTGTRTKHDSLALRDQRGPSRFFYVVPDGMLTAEDVPEFSGLVTFNKHLYFKTVKKAPRLHEEKPRSEVMDHLRGIYYWRYWTARGVSDPGGPMEYEI